MHLLTRVIDFLLGLKGLESGKEYFSKENTPRKVRCFIGRGSRQALDKVNRIREF
jgi:hypothetical protein